MGIEELAATSSSSGGFNPTTLIFIVVIVVAFYMLLIRPQQRRKQQQAQQQNTVQPGARVRTTAGMYATVVAVDGDDVILEVAPGVESRFMKRAVMDVVSPPEAEEDVAEDVAPADETDTEYAADDDEAAEDAPAASVNGSSAPSEEDSEEAAYEQATGTKKD